MAEESMLSTAESGLEPPPGAPAGAGAQAEMITKKLANYWCIIGSIPFVMFLLVAIPTIFYVKKFSEYVNAEYCDSKSCKDLSDVILKALGGPPPCKSFSKHVCTSKADFMTAALKNLETLNSREPGEGQEPPKGNEVFPKGRAYLQACKGDGLEDLDAFYSASLDNINIDGSGQLEPGRVSGVLSTYGVDGLVRAVAFVGNNSGNQEMKASIELSAPIQDTYPRMLYTMSGKTYKDVIAVVRNDVDEDLINDAVLKVVRKALDTYIITTTKAFKDNRPRLVTYGHLIGSQNTHWKWSDYLKPINDAAGGVLQGDTQIRLAHPKYLLGLDKFIDDNFARDNLFVAKLNVLMQIEALIFAYGRLAIKGFTENSGPLCVLHTDRILPGVLGHNTFYARALQFGAPTGINPGGTNASAMVTFLDKEVREMLDSMAFSYSLSTSATEENRVAFYRRTNNMTVSPGFFNNTDGLNSAEIAALSETAAVSDGAVDFVQFTGIVLDEYKKLYWGSLKDMHTAYFKFRNPYHSLHATYTPTENHLYVPMGVFTPPIYRNSQKNRIFAGTSGYLVMTGVMRALTFTGAVVVNGQLSPENWIGYSWTRKMERYTECLAKGADNSSLDIFMYPYMIGAVTPALRYYRRKIFEKAYPRPEFRIDWVSDLSSTQIFFYSWSMLYCGTTQGRNLIDLATKNNRYFLESFECEAELTEYNKQKPSCDLWETTRREY